MNFDVIVALKSKGLSVSAISVEIRLYSGLYYEAFSNKEDTTVYETLAERHMKRAVFELTDLADTPFLFNAAGYVKLSDGDGQAALRQAGYQTT